MAAILSVCPCLATDDDTLTIYVNTMVGTAPSTTLSAGLFGRGSEECGQTLPAVAEPNGMTLWTPQTRATEQKCVAPYYHDDNRLQGFRASHWINGGCTQDYGSMTLMAMTDSLRWQPEARAASFSHDGEVSSPDYYAVDLSGYDIKAEMTGRSHSAIFRFSFGKGGKAYLTVEPNSDEGMGSVEIIPERRQIRIVNPVHRIYQGWGDYAGFDCHFIVEYQGEAVEYGIYKDDCLLPGSTSGRGGAIGAYIAFDVAQGEELLVKAAASFVDYDGALNNMKEEIPHWNFDTTHAQTAAIWERQLSSIEVESGDERQKRLFYSALYRASLLPRTFSDTDGRYPSFAHGTPTRLPSGDAVYYDDFSLWDTYRCLHPLLNILSPRKAADMMQSLVYKYEQGGWMPIFPCWNSYTAAMIGDHATAVIADAYVKGITGFDIRKAYEGMRQNAFQEPSSWQDYIGGKGRRALRSYLKYGYIPLEDKVSEAFHKEEQVSRTMEYAFDDFALSQVAKALGYTADYEALKTRAKNYRNVIDPRTGYAQGRHSDGAFISDDAFSFAPFVTEGAPCHYTWYAPHDVYGLIGIMGGREMFVAKLDSLFALRRYWHGNEPCHQIAYLYNYAAMPYKTQRQTRLIMSTEYDDVPGGLSGNDDAGQMSAWYVFSAMGFYPVCPASPYYILGSPSLPRVAIRLENGNTFTIIAENASPENVYIQKATLNGNDYNKNYITHHNITSGATLILTMGPEPNKQWGANEDSLPPVTE